MDSLVAAEDAMLQWPSRERPEPFEVPSDLRSHSQRKSDVALKIEAHRQNVLPR
jgi:hypothetical protein